MIRIVLGKLGNAASVTLLGDRVMFVGASLLVDGRRVARKSTVSSVWTDEFGRGWDTIDFHAEAAGARATATHDDGDAGGSIETLREVIFGEPKGRTG